MRLTASESIQLRERGRGSVTFDKRGQPDRLPRVSVGVDFNHGAEPGRKHLLAVQRVRRNLECRPQGHGPARGLPMEVNVRELTRELEELIAALDRRVPCVERAGEAAIARDAAALRERAVDRLAELASCAAVRRTYSHTL